MLHVLACLALAAAPARPATLTGQYVEARTCDVWVGACFANAEMNLTGKHATLVWKVDAGSFQGVRLDGLAVVAVIEATDTLGLQQRGPTKAVVLVDEQATPEQQAALVALVRQMGGPLTARIAAVRSQPIQVKTRCCQEDGCAEVAVGSLGKIVTRCLHEDEDKVCGHEDNFYPPLVAGVQARSAMVTEHQFTWNVFNTTWEDANRRGAFVGSFHVR